MNIQNLKNATLEGKIFVCNTLFADNGLFPEYQGIYKVTEYEEIEGEPIPIKTTKKYYTWVNGSVTPLTIPQVKNMTQITTTQIKKAIENISHPEEYITELIDIAVNEF